MTDHTLFVEYISDRFTDSHHVHVRQTLLREEAASVNAFLCCEFVKRPNELDATIRLNNV
jgi:hypothetical protein